jgi:two-component system, cell cycle sensor histidine kinase and response regulator CckA
MVTSVSPGTNPVEKAVVREGRSADQSLPEDTAEKRAVTLLLVDDDPMVREIGCLMLVELGYIVLTATDGAEAVDLFRVHNKDIALVFCDQILPGMDGWQTLAALHEINPAIPVIMASGLVQAREKNTENQVQPVGYLSKPYTMVTLIQALNHVFGHGERAA